MSLVGAIFFIICVVSFAGIMIYSNSIMDRPKTVVDYITIIGLGWLSIVFGILANYYGFHS